MKVPEKWRKKTIDNLFVFTNGTGFKASDWSKEGLPIIRIQNMNGSSEYNYYNGQIEEKWLVNPGQLLFAWAGTRGVSFGPHIWKGPKGVLNQHIYKLEPKIDGDRRWLYYALIKVTDTIERKAHGFKSTLLHVQKSDITNQVVVVPPLPEQKAIADLLSTWDEAIEKTERLIQAREKRLRQMSRWLLFGHKRLENKQNELVDGHFFRYPSDWELVKIGKVAKEVSLRNGESEKPVLSCSKYDGFVNSLDYFGKQVFSSDTSNYKVIKKGQFGYPSNHVEEGSIGLLEHCEIGIVSPIYVVFEATKDKVYSPYLFKLLKTDIYRHIFQVSTSSSVDRRGSLRWSDFSKIKVLLPPPHEQKQITETLSAAQHEIGLLKQLAEKYKTQKRGLMQKMLTGEWRVKEEIISQYCEA
ncbi:restriction endonuclease subunit S [Methanolobus sp. WCC5]|uniref:restriction endonuclease subunit S n=1 Tax=Methanolobus sp. WCC5 TaxID=3125785 RepID=UPI003243482F